MKTQRVSLRSLAPVVEALAGNTTQERRGNRLLAVLPLPFAVEKCGTCHTNYAEYYAVGDIVGAISLRVPLSPAGTPGDRPFEQGSDAAEP